MFPSCIAALRLGPVLPSIIAHAQRRGYKKKIKQKNRREHHDRKYAAKTYYCTREEGPGKPGTSVPHSLLTDRQWWPMPFRFSFARKLERPPRLHSCVLLATHHPLSVPSTITTTISATIIKSTVSTSAVALPFLLYLPLPPDIWLSDY